MNRSNTSDKLIVEKGMAIEGAIYSLTNYTANAAVIGCGVVQIRFRPLS